jgi:hypothetical protein
VSDLFGTEHDGFVPVAAGAVAEYENLEQWLIELKQKLIYLYSWLIDPNLASWIYFCG